MYDYNVITRIPSKYHSYSIIMQSFLQSSSNPWNWCVSKSSNLNHPCNPWSSTLELFFSMSGDYISLNLRRLERTHKTFGCYEQVSIYRKGWHVQYFGQKQYSQLIHLMCELIQTTKLQVSWTMKIDTNHTKFESIQMTQDEGWYDSISYDTVQPIQRDFFIRLTRFWIDSQVIRFINSWIDPPNVIGFWWYDSRSIESIQTPRKWIWPTMKKFHM